MVCGILRPKPCLIDSICVGCSQLRWLSLGVKIYSTRLNRHESNITDLQLDICMPVVFLLVKFISFITKTCPCNIQKFLKVVKNENFQYKNFDIFLIFAQNIDCGYTRFGAKIRKIGIPLHTPVLPYESGV